MSRGVDGRDIFIDDRDRQVFLRCILRLKLETQHTILAYCLMGNHFHFAVKVANIPLSCIMHRLLTSYAIAFNARHDRQGHLFQARYKSVLCLNDRYLIALVRYIHMNPVRAGMVAQPGFWPWSSHRQYLQRKSSLLVDTDLLFDVLHFPKGLNGHAYEDCMNNMDKEFIPWPSLDQTLPPLLREEVLTPVSIDALAETLFHGAPSLMELRSKSRRREISHKKKALAEASLENGHSLLSIARWMGCTSAAVHHLLHPRERTSKLSKGLTPT